MSLSPLFGAFSKEIVARDDLDLSTFANYREVRTKHIDLDWTIDWKKQLIHGSCTLQMEVTSSLGVGNVSLDSSYLDIASVEVDGSAVKHTLGDRNGVCGQEMKIPLGKSLKQGEVSFMPPYMEIEAHE